MVLYCYCTHYILYMYSHTATVLTTYCYCTHMLLLYSLILLLYSHTATVLTYCYCTHILLLYSHTATVLTTYCYCTHYILLLYTKVTGLKIEDVSAAKVTCAFSAQQKQQDCGQVSGLLVQEVCCL
jgi:hypothetical protein